MKRTNVLIATLMLTLITITLNAQVSFGVRAGTSLNQVDLPNVTDGFGFKNLTSANIGLVGEFHLSPAFSFQPEIGYQQKGFAWKQGLDIENIPIGATVNVKIKYLEMPLLAKYKFGSNKVKPYLMAGPTFGYAVDGKLKTKIQALIEIPISNSDINLDALQYKRFEIGALVGGGMNIPTKSGDFFMDIRYQRGLTGLNQIPIISENAHNSGFGFNLGYVFHL